MKLFSNFLKDKKTIIKITVIIILIGIIVIFAINNFIIKKTPIKIGFVNTFTGPASTPTIDRKDVVMLAIEQINRRGGIHGHKIELIIKDDKLDPEVALHVDQELIDEGVVAIIGHSFSSLCLKVMPLLNKNNILMISFSAQSSELTGLNDNFLRTIISLDKEIEATTQIAFVKLKLKKIAIVYDLINPELSKPAFEYFKKEIEKRNMNLVANIPFNSKDNFSTRNITEKIIKSGADGVYIITDAIHAALICKHLRINNSQIKIIMHGWAFIDPIFISEGGKAVDGVIGMTLIDSNLASKDFLDFENKFKERFKTELSKSAQFAYEAIHIILNALKKTNDPSKLKEVILKQKTFDGIDGKITFDEYGDPIRKLHIMEIQKGIFKNIGEIDYNEF